VPLLLLPLLTPRKLKLPRKKKARSNSSFAITKKLPGLPGSFFLSFLCETLCLLRDLCAPEFKIMKYLIAGLGNIGPEYELTRHNIGFLTLDQLADAHKTTFTLDRHAEKAEFKFKGRSIHLIKPTTFMNLSGKAVAYWLQELKIPKENLLVIVDDLALPFGSLRMRTKGSAAGHNGLKNIEQVLAGQDYSRLRFGIGNEFSKGQQVDFVLSNFSQEEFKNLPDIMKKANEMTLSFCTIGAERTMSLFND
jgi:PTH1 family peptidyl-tRNA hydrolase